MTKESIDNSKKLKDNCTYFIDFRLKRAYGKHPFEIQRWNQRFEIKSEKLRREVEKEAVKRQKAIRVHKETVKRVDGKRSADGLNWRVMNALT